MSTVHVTFNNLLGADPSTDYCLRVVSSRASADRGSNAPPQIQHRGATDEMIDAAEGKENKRRLGVWWTTSRWFPNESSESALIASIKVGVRRNQRVFLF